MFGEKYLQPSAGIRDGSCVEVDLIIQNDVEAIACQELNHEDEAVESRVARHVAVADAFRPLWRVLQVHGNASCDFGYTNSHKQ